MISSKIIELTSDKPGPTIAIFAGVHGNERAGILALQELIPKLSITRGKLFLAFANPPAIAKNVRMINKNLNRRFFKNNKGTEPEDSRARELMRVLDQCDVLLDLHMSYDEADVPFAICEDSAFDVASILDVEIISTNWTKTEPGGSDGYMFSHNKIGVCVECGPIAKAAEYKDFAIKIVYQFLRYFDMTNVDVKLSTTPKRVIKSSHAVYKKTENFTLTKGLRNFDKLEPGQVIATEKDKKYRANADECIIFPHYGARVNEEAYIIGNELEPLT